MNRLIKQGIDPNVSTTDPKNLGTGKRRKIEKRKTLPGEQSSAGIYEDESDLRYFRVMTKMHT